MQCEICGQPINPGREAYIGTTAGGHVHIACAERSAAEGTKERRTRALGHLAIVAAVAVGLLLLGRGEWWAWVVALVGLLIHPFIHQLWWRLEVLRAIRRVFWSQDT